MVTWTNKQLPLGQMVTCPHRRNKILKVVDFPFWCFFLFILHCLLVHHCCVPSYVTRYFLLIPFLFHRVCFFSQIFKKNYPWDIKPPTLFVAHLWATNLRFYDDLQWRDFLPCSSHKIDKILFHFLDHFPCFYIYLYYLLHGLQGCRSIYKYSMRFFY